MTFDKAQTIPAIIAISLLIAGCTPQRKPEQYLTVHRLHSSADPAAYVITQDIDEGRAGMTKQVILATTLDFATNGNLVNLLMNDVVVLQSRIPPGSLSEGSSTPQEVDRMNTLTISLPKTSLVLFDDHLVPAADLMRRGAEGMKEYAGEEAEKPFVKWDCRTPLTWRWRRSSPTKRFVRNNPPFPRLKFSITTRGG